MKNSLCPFRKLRPMVFARQFLQLWYFKRQKLLISCWSLFQAEFLALSQHQCKELAANSMCKCKFYSLDRVAVLPTWQERSWTTAVNRLLSLLEFVNNWSDSGFPHFEGQVKQHWKPICSDYYCGAFLLFSLTWLYNEKHSCVLSWWVTQRDTFFWPNTSI